MLTKEIAAALNQQINNEFQAAYLYLSMSCYCEEKSFSGMAHWLRMQAQEEVSHGMKIYTYLNDMEQSVTMQTIPQPKIKFEGLQDIFESALESEKKVASDLNQIATLALEKSDQMTYSFLKWFLDEQVEEISSVGTILDKVKLIGDQGYGLLMLDNELGSRPAGEAGTAE
ncbi:MAG: ferritin [Bdellovibrionales bacterium]|nr:ferritin [Bdellovibrionales bacterium]